MLDWVPTWDFDETIQQTVAWYAAANSNADISKLTSDQIHHYTKTATLSNCRWSS